MRPLRQRALQPLGFVKAPGGRDCPKSHPIKGNEPANIYYEPADAGYAKVVPEVCLPQWLKPLRQGSRR